jgi:hypothetical protein
MGIGQLSVLLMVLAAPNVAPAAASPRESLDVRRMEVDERRIALDEQKQRFEERKPDYEFWKTIGTCVAVLVPLLIAAYTLRSQGEVAARARADELKKEEARRKAEFRMKATELVLSSMSPGAATRRAAFLETAHPEWLEKGFFTQHALLQHLPGYMYEQRVELLRAMAARPEHAGDIAKIWSHLFGAKDLENLPELGNITNVLPHTAATGDSARPSAPLEGTAGDPSKGV